LARANITTVSGVSHHLASRRAICCLYANE
jgi:hypothetical protein